MKTEDIVEIIRDWSLIRSSDSNISRRDSRAILEEFYEWIDPEEELEVLSLDIEDK